MSRRSLELLWANVRLVVLDLEALWESGTSLPADEADAETTAAIERVRTTGQAVILRPRTRRVRYFQHHAAEAAGLTSESAGDEPGRAVTIRPGDGEPPAEAVVTHEGRYRAISIALVECEHGKIRRTWHRLVNPGVPVDPETYKKHRITTELLSQAPVFSAVAPELVARLMPSDREAVVLVAHNANFDAGVLRTEFELMGRELPDLPVLDTGGRIVRTLGLSPRDGSLDALLSALDIVNVAPHTATGDATATAKAALDLMRRAADNGFIDIAELLEAAGKRSSGAMRPIGRIRPSRRTLPVIAPDHVARHFVLSKAPTKAELKRWIDVAGECARLRCPDLGRSFESLVATAAAAPGIIIGALEEVLTRRASDSDGPGANTALGAIAATVARFCPMPAPAGFSGAYPINRRQAIAIYHRATSLTNVLPRCSSAARCAWCADASPCPRTELARAFAPAVLDPRWEQGKLTRGSTLLAWLRYDERAGWFFHRQESARALNRSGAPAGPALADAASALLVRAYGLWGNEPDRAARSRELLRRLIEDYGCSDPALLEMWAWRAATGGRPDDLRAAVEVCDRGIALRPEHGDAAWDALQNTRNHLAGRLGRMQNRQVIDEFGAVTNVRRHHPGDHARRRRPLRFVVA